MLTQATSHLPDGRYLAQVWDTLDTKVVRGVVGLKDRVEFEKRVNDTFPPTGDKPYRASFLSIDPASMSFDLPGILTMRKHPVTGSEHTLHSIIISLNDSHGWTREQIADWIETLDDVPTFGKTKPESVIHDGY